jgi:quinol monooxygenase YgiN
MVTVLARIVLDNWDRFQAAHDEPFRMEIRRERGNLTHHVLNQLDDVDQVVFLDTWSSPQDADSYYHSDEFQRDLADMGGTLQELMKLEETAAGAIEDGPGPV